ncbi:MAG TPA: ester cyclase [Anaerolineaceae bacterium]|nr:ester cyclase [Anaerolineaceae bacterium]
MSIETNKAIVRRIFEEIFNNRNFPVVDELIAPDYINHNVSLAVQGPEGVKKMAIAQFKAFPDLHTTIEDIIAEGDKVVVRATDHFSHQPDGKKIALTWIEILRLENGKAVEAWFEADLSSLIERFKDAHR